MEVAFNLSGTDWLERLTETLDGNVELALGEFVRTVHQLVVGRTPYDFMTPEGQRKHKPHLTESWDIEIDKENLVGTVFTDVPYAETLERGLYPGVGPRTKAAEGGIFSRQAVGGIVQPLIDDRERIDKAMDAVLAMLEKAID
jgi:hypothetical protein